MTRFTLAAFAAAAILSGASNASAGGLLADVFIKPFSPELAEAADNLHHQYKQANPEYGQWEEEFTNDVRGQIGLQPHCQPVFDKWGNELGCF